MSFATNKLFLILIDFLETLIIYGINKIMIESVKENKDAPYPMFRMIISGRICTFKE